MSLVRFAAIGVIQRIATSYALLAVIVALYMAQTMAIMSAAKPNANVSRGKNLLMPRDLLLWRQGEC
jgi:hypothetical protein